MARLLRTTGVVLIVLGMTILEFVAYELWGTSLKTNAKQAVLGRAIDATLSDALTAGMTGDPPVTVLPAKLRDGVTPWARIQIPKIDVDKVVVEGTYRGALANGPGHYVRTPLPGTKGAVGIAGHRTTWGAPFHNIDKLRAGDEIVLHTAAARYVYRVTRSRIVSPRNGSVLEGDPSSTAEHKLTLTTCEPKYSAARRLIVWADLESWQVEA